LPDEIVLELMRRDADCHPDITLFDEWATSGDCPYKKGIQRMHYFEERRELWVSGTPQMSQIELLKKICAAKNWDMRGLHETS